MGVWNIPPGVLGSSCFGSFDLNFVHALKDNDHTSKPVSGKSRLASSTLNATDPRATTYRRKQRGCERCEGRCIPFIRTYKTRRKLALSFYVEAQKAGIFLSFGSWRRGCALRSFRSEINRPCSLTVPRLRASFSFDLTSCPTLICLWFYELNLFLGLSRIQGQKGEARPAQIPDLWGRIGEVVPLKKELQHQSFSSSS